MPLAWLSFGALIAAIVLSCFTELNVGVIAIVLFLTLAGVTMLFAPS